MAPHPRTLILRAPGTTCDAETAYAFQRAGSQTETIHVQRLIEGPELFRQFQIVCIPGGFSYGDDIASGRIFALKLQFRLADALREFCAAGKLILGICNGFQVLLRSGLLSIAGEQTPPATLAWNTSGHFQARWVHLRVANKKCPFLAGIEHTSLPIAHAEGRFVAKDAATLATLEHNGQLLLKYAPDPAANTAATTSANPNGSQHDVAGMCDVTGRIFGLMPHPERAIDSTQLPHKSRSGNRSGNSGENSETPAGLLLFQNAVNYFR